MGRNYIAQLPHSGELIDVAVRRLDHSFWLQKIGFDKEISLLSSLKHENIVSMVGYCYENDEMIILNKRQNNGSLNRHLNSPLLTWMRRLKISVGAASTVSYLHNGEGVNASASVIHHNVNSASILLDENWVAKLSCFEHSLRIPAGHLDLAYEKLGIGNYKSDVFSFGIVLYEILCGTKAFTAGYGSFQAALALFQYESRKLHELIEPDLFSQMEPQFLSIFLETAYLCLKEQRAVVEHHHKVLKRLDIALKLQQKHENHEHSIAVERTLSPQLKSKLQNLEHMRFQLNDIVSATEFCL